MPRPSILPTWATDANYGTGPLAGQPTKLEPAAGIQLQGFYPEMPGSSRHQNWWQNLVHLWISHFSTEYPLVEVFESNGTWTKPAWAKWVYAVAVGRGGLAGADNGPRRGGAGGSGFIMDGWWRASFLQSTMAVVVARHDTADTESVFGSISGSFDRRVLRARSGGNGGNATGSVCGGGGDGWAGGGGGAGGGGTGGIGGLGYGGRDGGILAPVPLGTGTGPGGVGRNGGNGNTATNDDGTGGSQVGPGVTGGSPGSYATGGASPLVPPGTAGFSGATAYGAGASKAGAGSSETPGNGVVIVVSY